ncbi:MAG TPA: EstA family serine hydrolase [Myxococcales bacterium]|nr:EstA family serine hydrolase [Myxococcales bacterium]
MSAALIFGEVAEGFEKVEQVFRQNFADGKESGAACAVYYEGKKVVDLWGGYRDESSGAVWQEDTMVPVMSTSKGISSVSMLVAHARGYIDFDRTVSSYWPEFAQEGKGDITVRQLLSHQAGCCAIDEPLRMEDIADTARLESALAKQKPLWKAGEYHGYHAVTLGWLESALIRRCDPKGRSLGQFFQEEIAEPLGVEFYFGLPEVIPDERIAVMKTKPLWTSVFQLNKMPIRFVAALMNPFSVLNKTVKNPAVFKDPRNINDRALMSLEVPAVCGLGRVESMARLYGLLAEGGEALGLGEETIKAVEEAARPPAHGLLDRVLAQPTSFSLGYMKPFPGFPFGSDARAYGTPGAGGSFAYADPTLQMGFAYGLTEMDFYLFDDPRDKALREAAIRCIRAI